MDSLFLARGTNWQPRTRNPPTDLSSVSLKNRKKNNNNWQSLFSGRGCVALEVVSAGRLDRRRMYYPRVLTMATRPDGTARADQQRIRSQLDLFWRRLLSVVFALAHLICFFFIPPFAKAETWYTPMCPLALTSVQNCVSKRRIASVFRLAALIN